MAVLETLITTAAGATAATVGVVVADFAHAIDTFLDRVAVDTVEQPLSLNEFEQASLAPAAAQLELVNAIRRSLGRRQGSLSEWPGGSLVRPEST